MCKKYSWGQCMCTYNSVYLLYNQYLIKIVYVIKDRVYNISHCAKFNTWEFHFEKLCTPL